MNPYTGETIQFRAGTLIEHQRIAAAEQFGIAPDEVVTVSGDPEVIRDLSARVRLGASTQDARRRRRRLQRSSRKRNR